MAKLLYQYRGLLFNLLLIALSFVFTDAFRPFLEGSLDQRSERLWSIAILLLFAFEMPALLIKGTGIAHRQAQRKGGEKEGQNTVLALLFMGTLTKIVLDTLFIQVALEQMQIAPSIGWIIAGVALKNLFSLYLLFNAPAKQLHFSVEMLADITLVLIANMAYVFLQEAFLSPIDLDNIRLLVLLLFLISLLFLLFYIPYRLPYVLEDWQQQRSVIGRISYTLSYFVILFLFLRPSFYQSAELMQQVRQAHKGESLYFKSDYGRLRTEQLKEICSWTELQELQLKGLSIDYLSPCWKNMRQLRYWDMSYNDLRSLPSLNNYPQLDTLLLRDNNFNKIDFLPINPHGLKALDLSNTRISYLPEDMAKLPQLRWLSLDYTPIDSFPTKALQGLQSLEILSCRKLTTAVLPPFAVSEKMLPQLRQLRYSSKAETIEIDLSDLKNIPQLQTLDLRGQYLSEKQKQQLRQALPEVELLLDTED